MGILDRLFGKKANKAQNSNGIRCQKQGNVDAEKIELDVTTINSLRQRYVAFDVETTGFSSNTDRIVELGAVVFENGKIVNQYSTLINPGMPIPESASKINHITNDMLRSAPTEAHVYPTFVDFLGDALSGKTFMCAHNAKFDMDFLSETLKRLGYNGTLRYVDTLALSRKYLKCDNYKQDTVAGSFGIMNQNAHRAVNDAEICGKIFWNLLEIMECEIEKKEKQQEKALEAKKLSVEEKEICAVIQDAILKRGGSSQWLRFYKDSSGYVDACDLYSFIKFKISSNGKYIIIPSDMKTPTELFTEKCSVNEGGTNYMRLFFNSPFDIDFLCNHFFSLYRETDESRQNYFDQVNDAVKKAEQSIALMTHIPDSDVSAILDQVILKNYALFPTKIETQRTIKREDVVINAVHSRCPLSQIKNYGNFNKGFEAGFPLYEQAEILRKSGDVENAISLYDEARAVGYDAPALYVAYARAYRKIKDYANEIVIVEEFMERNPKNHYGELEARREKAIELLYNLQQAEKTKAEKDAAKAQAQKEKEDAKAAKEVEQKLL